MIVCVEGPSAIGKSTMCRALVDQFHVVPEANELFQRAFPEEEDTYLKLQQRRYQMAASFVGDSILDGDILQPLWYNWAYGFPTEYQSFDFLKAFYLNAFSSGAIGFPDLYILYAANIERIRSRREGDATRSRRNFDRHLSLIEYQNRYFDFLSQHTSASVEFIEYDDFDRAKESTLLKIDLASSGDGRNDLDDIRSIFDWLESNTPSRT